MEGGFPNLSFTPSKYSSWAGVVKLSVLKENVLSKEWWAGRSCICARTYIWGWPFF